MCCGVGFQAFGLWELGRLGFLGCKVLDCRHLGLLGQGCWAVRLLGF